MKEKLFGTVMPDAVIDRMEKAPDAVAEGIRIAVVGVAVGVGLALLAARWVEPLLFRQSATDPATFATVMLVSGVVATMACYIPARRATRVDPTVALRTE